MDPISTALISALAALTEPIVKDAYNGVKLLIQRKFGADSRLTTAVESLEQRPESKGRMEVLVEEVAAAKAQQDCELLDAAKSLIKKIESQPEGKQIVYNVTQQITGHRNIVSGTGDININEK